MVNYYFTKYAEKLLLKLPKEIQKRIINKIEFFIKGNNPLEYAKKIHACSTQTYRFKIGDYRVIFDWDGSSILIIKVGHRREIYRF